jgi:DNA-binding NtrC family response regulator
MKVLVVDDDELTRISVKSSLEDPKLRGASGVINQVTAIGTVTEARELLARERFDLAFLDIRLGPYHKNGGIDLLKVIRDENPTTVVIMMTSVEDYETVEKCLLAGAADYIFKPFDFNIVHHLMIKAQAVHRLFRQRQTLKIQAGDRAVSRIKLTTKSRAFQKELDQVNKLKGGWLSVLILGENGVGKEVMARHIWSLEEDDQRPLIALDTTTIPANLVESALFGHTKNAFTGANEAKIGRIRAADGGDLFLDELANMPLDVQQKLLRVLQDKKVQALGSNDTVDVNFRLICATNGNIESMVKAGAFREDLYFRIKRLVVRIPALRDRREDIPDFVDLFLGKYSLGKKRLSNQALELCMEYSWPGNVRELEGAIETLCQISESNEISRTELESQLLTVEQTSPRPDIRTPSASTSSIPFGLCPTKTQGNYKRLLLDFEQAMFRVALDEKKSVNGAAQHLGLSRSTLVSKLKTWGWDSLAERQ